MSTLARGGTKVNGVRTKAVAQASVGVGLLDGVYVIDGGSTFFSLGVVGTFSRLSRKSLPG